MRSLISLVTPLYQSIPAIAVVALSVTSLNAHAEDKNTGEQEGGVVFGLWTPFAPPQNPVTEEKRVLGKILFWDEQLSSDNTISCGTCHIPAEGGVDPRIGVNPSFDGIFATPDDVTGSPGLIRADSSGHYVRDEDFDLSPRTTGRRSMTTLTAMYANNMFWDGRAQGDFIDPISGAVIASASTGLEIQSLGPILNDVEMAHQERDWPEVVAKLEDAKPLALASDIPQDMNDAILANESYPLLFEQAFGDSEITPTRIAFALATYERTLVPDQAPWDLFNAGDTNAMTADQIQGWNLYQGSQCNNCHVAPLFTTNTFVTNGIRPVEEDVGRNEVSGFNSDRGAFRMGTLRNMGIRDRFNHTGGMQTMDDVFDFYAQRNGRGPVFDNLDFRLFAPIAFSPSDENLVQDFINNALTDPRAASETFPFDRPTLHSELTPNPMILAGGDAGTSGFVPKMIAVTPPNIGNTGFKIGLDFALGGAQAWVAISSSPPVNGVVAQDELVGPIDLNGMSAGDGYGTLIYPIDDVSLDGQDLYMQWVVADSNANDGFARSDIARVSPFCSMTGSCAQVCLADLTDDGLVNFFDVSAFLGAFSSEDPIADFDGNGVFNFFDVSAFLNAFSAGCP